MATRGSGGGQVQSTKLDIACNAGVFLERER